MKLLYFGFKLSFSLPNSSQTGVHVFKNEYSFKSACRLSHGYKAFKLAFLLVLEMGDYRLPITRSRTI